MLQRVFCCSDTHGSVPPSCDERDGRAWLHCGDLCNGAEAIDSTPIEDSLSDPILNPVAQWFASRQTPVYYVQGNHDVSDPFQVSRWAKDVTGLVLPVGPRLFIAGIGWHGERYFELPFERDLQPCCDQVLRIGRRVLTSHDNVILMTHYPPRYVSTHQVLNDQDGGGVWYDCVRGVAENLNVVAVVQGHNHQWFGDVHRISSGERTILVANPGPAGCQITLDTDSGKTEISDLPV